MSAKAPDYGSYSSLAVRYFSLGFSVNLASWRYVYYQKGISVYLEEYSKLADAGASLVA